MTTDSQASIAYSRDDLLTLRASTAAPMPLSVLDGLRSPLLQPLPSPTLDDGPLISLSHSFRDELATMDHDPSRYGRYEYVYHAAKAEVDHEADLIARVALKTAAYDAQSRRHGFEPNHAQHMRDALSVILPDAKKAFYAELAVLRAGIQDVTDRTVIHPIDRDA